MTHEVIIPPDLDPEIAQELLNHAADKARAERERDDEIERIYSDDAAFSAFERQRDQPLVRASTYGNTGICHYQEVLRESWWGVGDPRRPVLMRGSCEAMIRTHGRTSHFSANGLCERIGSPPADRQASQSIHEGQ